MSEKVYFSLGSNRGDRLKNLESALAMLESVCRGIVCSRVYETEPLYYKQQPRFLNLAACGNVSSTPRRLLLFIHTVEKRLGRERGRRFGPRPIDIDILLFGNRILQSTNLSLPHPRLQERKFVLLPLLELAPALRDPGSNEPIWKSLLKTGPEGVYFHSFSRYTKSSLKPKWTTRQ